MKELRVKNTTPIKNDVLQALIGSGLNGTELSVALFVYRKTIGWEKESDKISLSQFGDAIASSRKSITVAIKTLKLVKIITLVKKGNQSQVASEYAFNEIVSDWKLVKKTTLVKKMSRTSVENVHELVKKTTPTKETITKETKQKKGATKFIPPTLEEVQEYINSKGYDIDATPIFDGYDCNDWKDSQNKQIKNWKQKINQVWLSKAKRVDMTSDEWLMGEYQRIGFAKFKKKHGMPITARISSLLE